MTYTLDQREAFFVALVIHYSAQAQARRRVEFSSFLLHEVWWKGGEKDTEAVLEILESPEGVPLIEAFSEFKLARAARAAQLAREAAQEEKYREIERGRQAEIEEWLREEEKKRVQEAIKKEMLHELLKQEAKDEAEAAKKSLIIAEQLAANASIIEVDELAQAKESAQILLLQSQKRSKAIMDAAKATKDAEQKAMKHAEEEARRLGGGADRLIKADIAAAEEAAEANGGTFIDPDFPHSAESLGHKRENAGSTFKRYKHFVKELPDSDEHGMPKSFDPADIVQGELEDSWFLSAISCLATRPNLLRKLFVYQNRELGVHVVRFYKSYCWIEIMIDDYFPTDSTIFSSGKPLFASCNSGHEWISVLEKAYAKLHGSYGAIEGGFIANALVDMTAGQGESVVVNPAGADVLDGSLWSKLLLLRSEDTIMGTSSLSGSNDNLSPSGIVQGHAYTILDVRHVDGYRLLKLQNPWGKLEWKGAWSDNSVEWTPRLRSKLDRVELDDGTFWMCFEDFVENFNRVYTCRIFDDSWFAQSAVAAWEGQSAGGCNNSDAIKNNPQFLLSVSHPSMVYLVLQQDEVRGDSNPRTSKLLSIGFVLLKLNGKKLNGKYYKDQKHTCSGEAFANSRSTAIQASLDPNDGPYTVVPSAFVAHEENGFTIRAYSKRPGLTLTALSG